MTAPIANEFYCVANGVSSSNAFIEFFASRDPTTNDVNFPIQKRWFNTTSNNEFILVGFTTSQGLKSAIWEPITTAGSSVKFPVPFGTSPVVPDATGNVSLTSTGGTITITGGTNSINLDVTGGLIPIQSFAIDTSTGPGTNPTLATGAGLVTIQGRTVAAQNVPIRTNAIAANAFFVEAQYASANATSNGNKAGFASFNSTHMTVDAVGWVDVNKAVAAASSASGNAGIASFDSTSFAVDANGFVKAKSGATPGTSNLGIAYAATTFTVEGFSGTALSATNIAYTTMQSSTAGLLQTVLSQENYTFTDGAGGTTATARFGLVAAVNWLQDIPFFLYVVTNATPANAPALAISRNPIARVAPVAASISVSGGIINVDQSDFYLLTGATTGIPTKANYASQPCLCVGAFRMQFTGATNSWTVTSLSVNDGIGRFLQGHTFTLPASVNNATAGTFFNNAGTPPTFTTQQAEYRIADGMVDYSFAGTQVNNVTAGANNVRPILPYASSMTLDPTAQATGYFRDNATGIFYSICSGVDSPNAFLSTVSLSGNTGSAPNTTFTANCDFLFTIRYPAYRSN